MLCSDNSDLVVMDSMLDELLVQAKMTSEKEEIEGGTPAHPFSEKPVHRLPVFHIGTAAGIKRGLGQFV